MDAKLAESLVDMLAVQSDEKKAAQWVALMVEQSVDA